jgi:hypothetical protein
MGTGAKALMVTSVFVLSGTVALAQVPPPRPSAPQPTIESHGAQLTTSRCAAISTGHAELEPIARLCDFALSYHRSLPNFICKEEMASRPEWPGGPPVVVTQADVVYQDGIEQRSNVRTDGKPITPETQPRFMTFQTHGEFGNELIDLFTLPDEVTFKYERRARLNGAEVLEFSFRLAREHNFFWGLGDGRSNVLPGFRGDIWLDAASGRLRRQTQRAMNLPLSFRMQSAERQTDYDEVDLGEVGTFLLPVRSSSQVCLRAALGTTPRRRCMTNTIEFRGCRKFAGKARIVGAPQ